MLKTNLILLAIAVLLGLLAWRYQPSQLPPLSQLHPQEITLIEISRAFEKPIIMKRIHEQWLIDDQPANTARIKQLLTITQTPSLHRFTAPQDLRPFGLSPAPLVLRLNQEPFIFGGNDPINGWRYVLYQGVIHLIGDGFHHHLNAPAKAWRENPDA